MTRPNAATELYSAFHNRGIGYGGMLTYSPNDSREQMIESMYRRKLTETALARFKWTDLPKSIDVRFMEWALFYHGLIVIHYDDRYGAIIANRARPEGNFNMYDNPRYFWAYGANYPGKRMRQDECAPVWATITRMGTDNDIVNLYAAKLANIDRTIEINIKNARRPKAIALEEEEHLSVDNIIQALDRGDPVIKVTNSNMLDRIERTLDFGVDPKAIEVLSVVRARIVNEAMAMLGIDGANQDKKERLVAAEVDANGEQIEIGKHANLISREQGVELINRRLGEEYNFECSVSYSTESDDDADVYNDASGNQEFDSVRAELAGNDGNVSGVQPGVSRTPSYSN